MQGRTVLIGSALALAALVVPALAGFVASPREGREVEVRVLAGRFAFDPPRITVDAGDRFTLRIVRSKALFRARPDKTFDRDGEVAVNPDGGLR